MVEQGMIALLIMLLLTVLVLYGRSVGTTLVKSVREVGIYLLVLLSIVGLAVLFFTTNINP